MNTIRVYLETTNGDRSHDMEFSPAELSMMTEDDIRLAFVDHSEFDNVVIDAPESYKEAA